MRKPLKKLTWIGISFVLGAGLLLLTSKSMSTNFDSYQSLVDQEMDLASGDSFESKFITVASGRYFINLNFKKTDDISKLECQLGLSDFTLDACDLDENAFDVTWHITAEGNDVADGSSLESRTASYTSNMLVRELGWFDAAENNEYTIRVVTNQSHADLDNLDPRLSIAIAPTTYKDEIVLAMFLVQLAVVTFCLGAFILLISLCRYIFNFCGNRFK